MYYVIKLHEKYYLLTKIDYWTILTEIMLNKIAKEVKNDETMAMD